MIWELACRKCGFHNIWMRYPFTWKGDVLIFPRCPRCGGETYRPSLEDDFFDMDEAHDVQDDSATGGSKWLNTELQGRWAEEAKADRGYE
jgi:hypothetical protein